MRIRLGALTFGALAVLSMATGVALTTPGGAWAADEDCLECHQAPDGDAGEGFLIEAEDWQASVHADLGCDFCHSGTDDFPHEDEIEKPLCADCHEDEDEEYGASEHGQARGNGTNDAPDCDACHGGPHAILAADDPDSPINPSRLPETCGHCHANPDMVAKYGMLVARPVEAYRDSVHSRVVEEHEDGATCNDCHGSHAIFRARDPRSSVFHTNVSETCGGCHADVATAYDASVHGTAAMRGVREAPVCTDCHGEHRILSPQERGSPVYATNIPKMTCGRCHSDLRLSDKFNIPADMVQAYESSYHGLASRAGRPTVAHCASCHGVHDIQPSTDRRSHIHPDNLSETCGQCHPGAGERFAIGQVHVMPTQAQHFIVYYARITYLWLIYLTIGGMLLHNLLDFLRKSRSPIPPPPDDLDTSEVRMPSGFRIAHGILLVSFGVLVYTGFALTYPESWWARPLLSGEGDMDLRGWLHRIAAVAMLGALAFHVVHVLIDRRARRCMAHMIPSMEDVHEVRERFRYFFGQRAHPPAAPVLGYPEKLEYLALMWGILVMAATGFLLWYENVMLAYLPKWVSDLATVIHFYEAVLASLAIVVWHFYFVIFDPLVYPMDTAWLTGRAPATRVAERANAVAEAENPNSVADSSATVR